MTNWPCIFGEDFLGLVMYISGGELTDRASIVKLFKNLVKNLSYNIIIIKKYFEFLCKGMIFR